MNPSKERERQIVECCASGMRLHVVGKKFGIPTVVVRQIFLHAKRVEVRADRMTIPSIVRFDPEYIWTPERQYLEFRSVNSE
jgi:hypothetical protein